MTDTTISNHDSSQACHGPATLVPPKPNPDYRLHPTQLSKRARSQHVVDALLDYNSGIIANNPGGASAKFAKLTDSPFVFFRGTADLMYRDLQGTHANMAIVQCMGDVHLENFGVMEAENGQLLWGLNDFDEACFAPFSWDVCRGATSVVLAARERGFDSSICEKLAENFAGAYLATIGRTAEGKSEAKAQFTKKRGPKMIRRLIREAAVADHDTWLMERYLDRTTGLFRTTDEVVPVPDRLADFQVAIDAYLPTICARMQDPPTRITVLDVATKTGSGTGSIGLWRYYALVEPEPKHRGASRLLLELKQERCSVLHPYVGDGPLLFFSEGARVMFAENVQLPHANPYYGYTLIDGNSYLVREKSPHKARVSLDKLNSRGKFRKYAEACAAALAFAHARSDRTMGMDESVAEQQILKSVNSRTFVFDVGRFAVRMARQVKKDWKSFVRAYETGKFDFGDVNGGASAAEI